MKCFKDDPLDEENEQLDSTVGGGGDGGDPDGD